MTKTNLISVWDDILEAAGEEDLTMLVLLQLSAAFDTVDHPLLDQSSADGKTGAV